MVVTVEAVPVVDPVLELVLDEVLLVVEVIFPAVVDDPNVAAIPVPGIKGYGVGVGFTLVVVTVAVWA
jgi:hypothetical protein